MVQADSKSARSIKVSEDINDIIAINRRSTYAKTPIRIVELGSLNDLIPFKTAESIRRQFVARKVRIMQLTNHKSLKPWTSVEELTQRYQTIRYIPSKILLINVETLIFDDIVALYSIKPNVLVTIIQDKSFAEQQSGIFDAFWQIATPTHLSPDGGTTLSVTINRPPKEVYKYISNLDNWHEFSDFAANFEKKSDDEYIAHTPQGDITVKSIFDSKRMLLDTICVLPDGEEQVIPYRVVPNGRHSELIMTNFRPHSSSREEYDEQLTWMQSELFRAKQILEGAKP